MLMSMTADDGNSLRMYCSPVSAGVCVSPRRDAVMQAMRSYAQAPDGNVSIVTDAPVEDDTLHFGQTARSDAPNPPSGARIAKGIGAVEAALRWCAALEGRLG